MELNAAVQPILAVFGDGQAAFLQAVVEADSRRLPGLDGHLLRLLGDVVASHLLCDSVLAGLQVVDLHLTLAIACDGLVDAVAGNVEGDALHLAVLGGFDNLGGAVGHVQLEIGGDGVSHGLRIGDGILLPHAGAKSAVVPHNQAHTLRVLFAG